MAEPVSPGITKQFADFAVALRYEDLQPEVIAGAKNGILDLLGVALVGATDESTQMILNAAVGSNSTGGATIVGKGVLTTPAVAALVNAFAAHTLNYDDTQHRVDTTHMSAPVLPAVLAVAETHHCTGKESLTAYVAGFEIGCRLGRVARFATHLSKSGINPTGFLGHFGAAAAAGKLMGLDASQMNTNFGLAAGQAAGLMISSGTMSKGQIAANAAHNGVLSAALAKQGFTGPDEIFDGKKNIFSIFGGQTDPAELLKDLGQDLEITSNTFKVYACAGWRNSVVAASVLLAETHALQPRDIKKVRVLACVNQMRLPNYPEPRTGLEGKFSAEHTAAVALVDRAGGLTQFGDGRVNDPAVIELRRRVTLEADDTLKPYQIRVEIHTVDGRELSHFIPIPKGDHLNPLSWDELVAKFRANASMALPQEQVEKLVAMVKNLETVADIASLMRLCRSANGAPKKPSM